jgi:predicted dinucleotide-binding enzyme
MKIGIIGSGNVGSRLAALISSAGHDVVVGSRSSPELKAIDAVKHGEIVILAIHYRAISEAIAPLANAMSGKIVVDASNPLNEDWSPLLLGQETSAGEEIAKLLPESFVVKAFNTIFADVMNPSDIKEQNITAFVASNYEDAVKDVATVASDCGFNVIAMNKLSAARYLEAMAHLNIELAVGQRGGTRASFTYTRAEATN